jgi:membrane-bound lytic murein transglycosylase B
MNRRNFIQCGAAATAATLLPATFAAPNSLPPNAASATSGFAPYAGRADVRAWAETFSAQSGRAVSDIMAVLAQSQSNDTVIRLMQPAPTGFKRSWRVYRSRFVEPIRIRAGLRFWQENAAALQRAEAATGVDAQAIVGILGVETIYGRDMGNFRVLDALATLSFDYLRRAEYFREELGEFLLFADTNRVAPEQVLGSFAGAMGLAQFMPSSMRKHAVDFDGDGVIDLRNSATDAIGSVARYLADYGWEPGLPIASPARIARSDQLPELLAQGPQATWSVDDIMARGVSAHLPLPEHARLLLVDLPTGIEVPEYRIGTANFYAITRYNRSFFYAAAVQDLGAAVAAARSTGA